MVSRANIQSDKRLTNTSVRKHVCQKLMENQVPDIQAVQITGHKNPNSLIMIVPSTVHRRIIFRRCSQTQTLFSNPALKRNPWCQLLPFLDTAWHNQSLKIPLIKLTNLCSVAVQSTVVYLISQSTITVYFLENGQELSTVTANEMHKQIFPLCALRRILHWPTFTNHVWLVVINIFLSLYILLLLRLQ